MVFLAVVPGNTPILFFLILSCFYLFFSNFENLCFEFGVFKNELNIQGIVEFRKMRN